MKKKSTIFIVLVFIFSLISFAILTYLLNKYNFLPFKHRTFLIVGLALGLIIIGCSTIFFAPKSRFVAAIIAIILLLMTTLQFAGAYFVYNTFNKFESEGQKNEQASYGIITLKDSNFDYVNEIGNSTIYYSSEILDSELTQAEKPLLEINSRLKFKKGDSYAQLYKDLIDKKLNYVLFNLSRIDIVEENRENFENNIKILKLSNETEEDEVLKISYETQEIDTKEVQKGSSFNIYISGADSYYGLYDRTRSDVNIIMSVNPKTKNILLTTLPRDSYVYMPGLGSDKLTHAGIYGIENSMATLENLFGITLDYYTKVNFSSVINIVDTIGGISIYNPNQFVSRDGFSYSIGEIDLTGETALSFVRERKNLPEGDIDRGRNQMRVINGIIDKLISFNTIADFNNILDSIIKSINTNLPSSKLSELINAQIESGSGWNIITNEVTGWEAPGLPSFAMPGIRLYMFQLDENSVYSAKEKIVEVLGDNNEEN